MFYIATVGRLQLSRQLVLAMTDDGDLVGDDNQLWMVRIGLKRGTVLNLAVLNATGRLGLKD